MIKKQLSIFLENRTGRVNDITRILGDNGINMYAFSIAENPEFGIMRIMVSSDVNEAAAILKEQGFTVKITDVIAVECPNKAGAMSHILEHLAKEEVFIEYMYAYAIGDISYVIIRPTDIEKSVTIIDSIS